MSKNFPLWRADIRRKYIQTTEEGTHHIESVPSFSFSFEPALFCFEEKDFCFEEKKLFFAHNPFFFLHIAR